MTNYYKALGLKEGATKEEIKTAYKKYASKFHPDKHNGDEFFKERFQEIKEAYEYLMKIESTSDQKEYSDPSSDVEILHFASSSYTIDENNNQITLEWKTIGANYINIVIVKDKQKQSITHLAPNGKKGLMLSREYLKFEIELEAYSNTQLLKSKHPLIIKNKCNTNFSTSANHSSSKKQEEKKQPVVNYFYADKSTVMEYDSITLNWDVSNASSVYITLNRSNKVYAKFENLPQKGHFNIKLYNIDHIETDANYIFYINTDMVRHSNLLIPISYNPLTVTEVTERIGSIIIVWIAWIAAIGATIHTIAKFFK